MSRKAKLASISCALALGLAADHRRPGRRTADRGARASRGALPALDRDARSSSCATASSTREAADLDVAAGRRPARQRRHHRRGSSATGSTDLRERVAEAKKPDFGLAAGVSQQTLEAIASCESGRRPDRGRRLRDLLRQVPVRHRDLGLGRRQRQPRRGLRGRAGLPRLAALQPRGLEPLARLRRLTTPTARGPRSSRSGPSSCAGAGLPMGGRERRRLRPRSGPARHPARARALEIAALAGAPRAGSAGRLVVASTLLFAVWVIAVALDRRPVAARRAGALVRARPRRRSRRILVPQLARARAARLRLRRRLHRRQLAGALGASGAGASRSWVHEKARPIALGWVALVTCFSLVTQAYALGLTGAQLAAPARDFARGPGAHGPAARAARARRALPAARRLDDRQPPRRVARPAGGDLRHRRRGDPGADRGRELGDLRLARPPRGPSRRSPSAAAGVRPAWSASSPSRARRKTRSSSSNRKPQRWRRSSRVRRLVSRIASRGRAAIRSASPIARATTSSGDDLAHDPQPLRLGRLRRPGR